MGRPATYARVLPCQVQEVHLTPDERRSLSGQPSFRDGTIELPIYLPSTTARDGDDVHDAYGPATTDLTQAVAWGLARAPAVELFLSDRRGIVTRLEDIPAAPHRPPLPPFHTWTARVTRRAQQDRGPFTVTVRAPVADAVEELARQTVLARLTDRLGSIPDGELDVDVEVTPR
jgi:hypothetical protein